MVRHILLIKLKSSVSTVQLKELRERFYQLQDKIDGINNIEWGLNNNQEDKNQGYTHAVVMTFIDVFARDNYLRNPEHEMFKFYFEPLLEDIIVFDYQI